MRRYVRILALISLVAILISSFSGCGYRGYRGKFKGAYTMLCAQVPDTLGARPVLFMLRDPQILRIDTDSYGRGLSIYLEDTEGPLCVGIVQREDVVEVYYYPEKSTLTFKTPHCIYDSANAALDVSDLEELFYELCSPETLEGLKAVNDWGLPINEEKLESEKIDPKGIQYRWSTRIDSVNLWDYEWLEAVLELARQTGHPITDEIVDDHAYFDHASYMATDDYGRRLYYVECYYYVYPEDTTSNVIYTRYYLEMVAILNPDGSYDADTFMVELADKTDYHGQISDLKIDNGWNTPYEKEAE